MEGKRPNVSASSWFSGTCSRLPTRNAPPRAPAHWRRRKARIASRENVRRCSSGPEHGAAERVVAEGGAVDQVLGHDGRLVVRARDLLDHDAALAVQLLLVDLRAPDEVRQQVDRLADDLGAARDVEGDEVVRRVGVEHRAHALGRLVDLAVVVVLLPALEHQVLEEVGHAVLLGPLRAGARLEGDEDGDGPRAGEVDAVERQPVRERRRVDLRHRSSVPVARCGAGRGLARRREVPSAVLHGCHRATCPAAQRSRARPQARRRGPRPRRRRRLPVGHQEVPERRRRAPGRDLRGRARRVRVPRREHGSGKSTIIRLLIKEIEPTYGDDPRGGARARLDHAQADPELPPQPRRRLPGLQAAAQPHGLRQRGLRAAGDRAARAARCARRCRTSCA